MEEIQLLKNPEPIKNLLFSPEVSKEKPTGQWWQKNFHEFENETNRKLLTGWRDQLFSKRCQAVHLWLTACNLWQLMETDVLIQYLCVVGVTSCQVWKNSKVTTKHVNCPQTRSLYAGSDSGVVQSPTAFCSRYRSCFDCILARDPYCAWDHRTATCVNIFDAPRQSHRYLHILYQKYF